MCLCHQAVEFGTGQMMVMLCGWEGNLRSGVALAMRHRLEWFIHLRVHGQGKGDEHHTYAHSAWFALPLPFFTILSLMMDVSCPTPCIGHHQSITLHLSGFMYRPTPLASSSNTSVKCCTF